MTRLLKFCVSCQDVVFMVYLIDQYFITFLMSFVCIFKYYIIINIDFYNFIHSSHMRTWMK